MIVKEKGKYENTHIGVIMETTGSIMCERGWKWSFSERGAEM